MKKNHKFDVMSDKKCSCGKSLKQNIVDRKPTATSCFACFRLRHSLATAREVRTGKKIGRKKGIYVID